jgi:hypothetical protein
MKLNEILQQLIKNPKQIFQVTLASISIGSTSFGL